MSDVLAKSQSKDFATFANDEGGRMEFGHFKIIQALAESSGATGIPSTPGPLPARPAPVPVIPAVGARGAISLAAFADGQAPFAAPLIAPLLHGAKSLTLSAPAANVSPVYYSQNPAVRPLGAVTALSNTDRYDISGFPSGYSFAPNTPERWQVQDGGIFYDSAGAAPARVSYTKVLTGFVPGVLYKFNRSYSVSFGSAAVVGCILTLDGVEVAVSEDSQDYYFVPAAATVTITVAFTSTSTDPYEAGFYGGCVQVTTLASSLTGNPLQPGESFIFNARDYDLSRPFYVVPVIGAAANSHKVIADYDNC